MPRWASHHIEERGRTILFVERDEEPLEEIDIVTRVCSITSAPKVFHSRSERRNLLFLSFPACPVVTAITGHEENPNQHGIRLPLVIIGCLRSQFVIVSAVVLRVSSGRRVAKIGMVQKDIN